MHDRLWFSQDHNYWNDQSTVIKLFLQMEHDLCLSFVLYNTLNTFYLRLYDITHMVNQLPPHGLLFPNSSKGSFICTIPVRITHNMAFVTPVVEHWLEREIAQWVHHEGSIRRPIAPWANEHSYHGATSCSRRGWVRKGRDSRYDIRSFVPKEQSRPFHKADMSLKS